jgi:hypothetical protein
MFPIYFCFNLRRFVLRRKSQEPNSGVNGVIPACIFSVLLASSAIIPKQFPYSHQITCGTKTFINQVYKIPIFLSSTIDIPRNFRSNIKHVSENTCKSSIYEPSIAVFHYNHPTESSKQTPNTSYQKTSTNQ